MTINNSGEITFNQAFSNLMFERCGTALATDERYMVLDEQIDELCMGADTEKLAELRSKQHAVVEEVCYKLGFRDAKKILEFTNKTFND